MKGTFVQGNVLNEEFYFEINRYFGLETGINFPIHMYCSVVTTIYFGMGG